MLYVGAITVFGAMFETMELDNALWPLIESWAPRIAGVMRALDGVQVLEAMAASLE